MFTAARALLALKEMDSSKHSGVIALFNQHIIKYGLFPKEMSKFLREAKIIREDADYEDFVKISKEDAKEQLKNAQFFVRKAEETLKKSIKDNEIS